MNKKGQGEVKEVIGYIFAIFLLIAFIPIFASLFNKNCPACDCSSYETQISQCQQNLSNATIELNNRKIIYINNTIEVPVEKIIEKPVYKDTPISIVIISLSLLISLSLTLFSFKIRLPKVIENKLEKLEKIILWIKIGSGLVTLLIFIKLIIILISIGK